MLILMLSTALAAEPAHYSTDAVAAGSETFRRYSEALAPRFEEAQRDLGTAGDALSDLELGVLLLGDAAPAELVQWYEDSRRRTTHAFLRTQAHVSLLEDDSTTTFGEALERAITGLGETYALEECAAASGIAAMTGPGARGTASCEGPDVSAQLSAALDQDPALTAAVDEILSIDWPETRAEQAAQPVHAVTSESRYVQLGALARAVLAEELESAAAELERKVGPLERDIEAGDEAALAEAEAARAAYEAQLAAMGQRLLAAAEKSFKKDKLELGLCANPGALGGCEGEPAGPSELEAVVNSKRFRKALR